MTKGSISVILNIDHMPGQNGKQVMAFLLPSRNLRFESDVVLNRSQTRSALRRSALQFESDVVLNRSQTNPDSNYPETGFESDVVLNRSQTKKEEPIFSPKFESDVVLNRSQTGIRVNLLG